MRGCNAGEGARAPRARVSDLGYFLPGAHHEDGVGPKESIVTRPLPRQVSLRLELERATRSTSQRRRTTGEGSDGFGGGGSIMARGRLFIVVAQSVRKRSASARSHGGSWGKRVARETSATTS